MWCKFREGVRKVQRGVDLDGEERMGMDLFSGGGRRKTRRPLEGGWLGTADLDW